MKISIVTATWNSGATLRHTMQSVLSQSYSDIEHIIVDGGSSDNTMEIVHELEAEYQGRLRYISEKDRGLYDAMNKGIEMATGEIVGILNSDDFYTSTDILYTVASAFENDIDAVYGDIHYVDNGDLNTCVRYYSSKIFSRKLMRLGFMPAHPSFYCKKSVYNRFGTFNIDYRIGADFENLLRLIFVNRIRIQYVEKDFVTMRTGGASTSGIASHKQILQDHQRAFKENGVYSNILLESLRYVYKIYELFATKIRR